MSATETPLVRALDVPAGAGGLSRGLALAGFQVQGVELDPDAVDTHRRHVGPCEQADMRTYHPAHPFDLVAGGPPCQPFSMAGKGLGDGDPLRAVLDACEAEYLTTWTVLDAADYGVPQHRDRLFVVGFREAAARNAFRWPHPSHAPPGELFGAPHRTVRQALSLPPTPHRTGRLPGAGWAGMRLLDVDAPSTAVTAGTNPDLLDAPAPCVTATEHKSAMNGTQPMSRRRASERLSDALAGAGLADRPATTIQADPRMAPAGHHGVHQMHGAVRLTVEQCALLQGFPAGWTWTGTKSSQHRQVGNAVPPPLAEAVGRAAMAALRASQKGLS